MLKSDSVAHADNAVTSTAVSMTPLCKYDIAVTMDLIFERLWLPLKGMSKEKHVFFANSKLYLERL
jgi:hypothetical protein